MRLAEPNDRLSSPLKTGDKPVEPSGFSRPEIKRRAGRSPPYRALIAQTASPIGSAGKTAACAAVATRSSLAGRPRPARSSLDDSTFSCRKELNLYGTRSSQYWNSKPGKFDALNLRLTFETSSLYEFPILQPTKFVPENLAAWNAPRQRDYAAVASGALHFFLDDYRFETVWTSPERLLERVTKVGAALTPDFSLWRDMPLPAQMWNIYRSRWCGAYWQSNGVEVIPTVQWSTPDRYDFCFDGLPTGGSVAISALGVRSAPEDRELFRSGVEQTIARIQPSTLLVYGRLRYCDDLDLPNVREYPTFWDRRRKQVFSWVEEEEKVEAR